MFHVKREEPTAEAARSAPAAPSDVRPLRRPAGGSGPRARPRFT